MPFGNSLLKREERRVKQNEQNQRRVTMVEIKPVDKTVDKQLSRTEAGRADYEYYVQNPRRDPVEGAISMRSTLEAKMRNAETWDKWEDHLKKVGGKGVIDAAVSKGPGRLVEGVRYGSKFYEQFYSEFKPHLERALDKVLALPRETLEDSKKRATTMIEENAKFSFAKSGT